MGCTIIISDVNILLTLSQHNKDGLDIMSHREEKGKEVEHYLCHFLKQHVKAPKWK